MSDLPQSVLELVEKFDRNIDEYKNPRYNETLIRVEFVNPFFKALGWDVDNEKGHALAYRDVIHEDEVKVGGATKAPDYSFRIGGTRKFFVETKKPSVNLKTDPAPAFQLRRYAYSARLPISILTDFEEFIVYNCRTKPSITDKPSADRILCISFRDYAEKWDEISSVFHRESILRGSFDRYVKDTKGKRGTAEIDRDFLADLDRWRLALAQNFALRNPSLTVRELNFAVQMTIDRLIFLRMCEDRGIETYGQLEALVNGAGIYPRLVEIYRKADDRYNSGLFHFTRQRGDASSPDVLTPGLKLDDRVVKDIIRNLYYPKCPYEFSLLPVEVLGNAYEQFLGKTIRLTAGHQAKIEEKPEVRKAGGVYYTPEYIVAYIVKSTVGRLLEGKTPKEAAAIRILDPACGSGSFLLGAYRCLLDWHLDWYKREMERTGTLPTVPPPKGTRKRKSDPGAVFQGQGGDWLLTTAEKKRILLNNIYGVDIDQQAVEVTKLSLLLRVLEDENQDTLNKQLTLWRERALPDLGGNIKCGNSLIGPDFFDGQMFPDEEEVRRVNPFDWQAEFPESMKAGGFDAVIGNPPYIRMEIFKNLKLYLKTHYACHDERSDLYTYFIERAHILLNRSGRVGMIVSNKFLRSNYGNSLREYLHHNAAIEQVVDFAGLPVFAGATVRTIILISKLSTDERVPVRYTPPLSPDSFAAVAAGSHPVEQAIESISYSVDSGRLAQPVWNFVRQEDENLLARLRANYQVLGEYCNGQICMGVKSGLSKAFVIDNATREAILESNPTAAEIIKPFLNGRDIRRYNIDYKHLYLIYTFHGIQIEKYPAVEQHLRPFKSPLLKRATRQEWYELQQPQHLFAPFMDGSKIIFPDIATTPRFSLDDVGYYGANTTYFIPRRDYYLLGLLNSGIGQFFFVRTCAGLEGKNDVYLRFFGQYLEGFPIRTIDFDDPADRAGHDRMVALVDQMLTLHKELPAATTDHEQTLIRRRIDATDRQIDALVYELYGLTPEEIAVVEESVR